MKIHKVDGYVFIIDTDSYSGNFEREMAAYVAGAVGESIGHT